VVVGRAAKPPRPLASGNRIVLDAVRWDTASGVNHTRASRYASALLANLGAAFATPAAEPDWIPAGAFAQVGTFDNYSADAERLGFGSEGAAEAPFVCASAGRYAVVVRGTGTSAEGEYAKARVTVDGSPAGEVAVASESPAVFGTGATVRLTPGRHLVRVEFTNDRYTPTEDRNLGIHALGFRKVTE
jgi:hypothetical protein